MKNFKTQENFISKNKDKSSEYRTSLEGYKFDIKAESGELKYKVEVGRLVGKGSSCLVYEVIIDDLYPPKKNMIMKEFYPLFNDETIKGERDKDNPLKITYNANDEESVLALVKERKKFMDSYDRHIRIIDIDPSMEDMVIKPYKLEKNPDFIFALFDTDKALSVDKYYNLDLGRIVDILEQTSEILSFLHRKNLIYMDLKPENILYDYKRNKVKLFDFDASVLLDDLNKITDFYIPSQKAFIPPELRYISNLDKRKDIFISEEIDLYMLGVTFFYLIMNRYPEEMENEDLDYLQRNIEQVLSKKTNRIFLNIETKNRIIDLLKESLSVHRYLSMDDFKEKLREIHYGLNLNKNKEIAQILSAAYYIYENPLYEYISEDETGKYIDIALVDQANKSFAYFAIIFSSVDLEDVELRFNIYSKYPKETYRKYMEKMPLISQTCTIKVNGRDYSKRLDTEITQKAYASLSFKRDREKIDQNYILILNDKVSANPGIAYDLYEEFKNSGQKRLILNYTRQFNESYRKSVNDVILYNIDTLGAATFKSCEFSENILDQSYRIHKLYTMIYRGERIDDQIIWDDFVKDDLMNLKSSIRSAISMTYRNYMAKSDKSDDVARDFYEKIVKAGINSKEISARDLYADREHHSWNRFMISQGYRRPSLKEFKSYAYIGENNHIDKIRKLHPLIVDSDIRKIKNGEEDNLRKASKQIHDQLISVSEDIDARLIERISNNINNTNWLLNDNLRELLPLWEELINMVERVDSKESYAINTLNQLIGIIDREFTKDFDGKEDLLTDYKLIKQDLKLLVQRNNENSYRQSDYVIIDASPLIESGGLDTVFAPFIENDQLLWANVVGAIKFDPQKLILLSDDRKKHEQKLDKIIRFMKEKRLQQSINIQMISYDQMKLFSKQKAIVDLTLNDQKDCQRPELEGLPYVKYLGSNKWGGNFKAIDYYLTSRTLTVEDNLFLNSAKFYNSTSENNLARLSAYYEKLWDKYLSYSSEEWRAFTEIFRQGIDKYIISLDYPRKDESSMLEVGDFIFRRNDKQRYHKLTSFLNKLKDEGILLDYKFPINPGKLKIKTINDDLTIKLGQFISDNIDRHFHGFDLRKLYFPLLREKEKKNIYLYAMSNKLEFTYKVEGIKDKKLVSDLNKMMEDMDDGIDSQREVRIFNHIGKTPYVSLDDQGINMSYEIGDVAFREFFEKGFALHVYTYFELVRKSHCFDEIKTDVGFFRKHDDKANENTIKESHLDIVCTREFSAFIINCRQEELKKEDILAINEHKKQFAMDAKAILINSYSHGIDQELRKMCQDMEVYLIDRKMLESNQLVTYLENIAKADKNWYLVEK